MKLPYDPVVSLSTKSTGSNKNNTNPCVLPVGFLWILSYRPIKSPVSGKMGNENITLSIRTGQSTPSPSRSGSPLLPIDDLWNETFRAYKATLQTAANSSRGIQTLDKCGYSQAMEVMRHLSDQAKRRTVPQCLARLQPAMSNLLEFSTAIATMAQTQDTPVALVWGCIEIILRVRISSII